MKQPQRIFIFDTTLRDGQQSPGAGMTFEDNLLYARQACELGVDVLEAGFPAASQRDFDIVHTIATEMAANKTTMKVAALCQLREAQVVRTMAALAPILPSSRARLHTYVAVDPNLMQASLGKWAQDPPRIIAEVYRLVKMAVEAGFEVEFSPEGYSRMQHNFAFTSDVIRAAVSAGATVINCPDTVGGAARWQGQDYFVVSMQKHADMIAKEFPQCDIIWSTHCHNDLGLALDNTLDAVFTGPARQIEGCINGVGERAGNVSLEQCIMAIEKFGRHHHRDYAFFTAARLDKLRAISNFIAERMLVRQPHWPITGENAARHSSGGHTNAILNDPLAYQPFDPQQVGHEISLVFGPLSGGNHAREIIEKRGYHCSHDEKATIAQAIKDRYAERRRGISDDELMAGYQAYRAPINIEQFDYSQDRERGEILLHLRGKFFTQQAIQISSCHEASLLAHFHHCVKAQFPAITLTDSAVETVVNEKTGKPYQHASAVISMENGGNVMGEAVDEKGTTAAIKAYIAAVNQAYVDTHYKKTAAFHFVKHDNLLKSENGYA